MSEIELIYFWVHGRVFVTRLLMELSEKPFKDTKVTFEEFAKIKPGKLFRVGLQQFTVWFAFKRDSFRNEMSRQYYFIDLPLGQLPLLKVDGETYVQSVAIARFAATQAGLPTLDTKQLLRSNMMIETLNELFDKSVIPAFEKASTGPAEDRANTFYGAIQEGAVEAAQKLEKVLSLLRIDDSTNTGLVSLSDYFVLNIYVFFNDSKVNSGDVFSTNAPTAMKIVNKLIRDCEKTKVFVEKAKKEQFIHF